MQQCHCQISLGFTDQRFPPGVHICQIFSKDEERQESALKFLLAGLKEKERATCFSDKVHQEAVRDFLEASGGVSFQDAIASGSLTLSGTRDVYFSDNRFDHNRMLELLRHYHQESLDRGYRGSRVIGEMVPEVQDIPGGESLLEYEAKVSLLLKEVPVTAVCQYSASDFSGAMIMDILKVHPYMIVRGSVVHNPFFIEPEDFLNPKL